MVKQALYRQLVNMMEDSLKSLHQSHQETTEGAFHEESRAENDKDTRGLEAGYLARGLAMRVAEQQEAVNMVRNMELRDFNASDAASLSAWVTLEDEEGQTADYFIAPAGAGTRLHYEGTDIRVVTPSAPLGKAMIGKYEGDDVALRGPKGMRELVLLSIQ